ncbi:uncharacterized protein LOC110674071 [Aedes aegypti]|uniref:Uncharacterized protein n=1 Tax=Aedes aegypti TaxID=7159 RepID=A0A6I8TY37_AEDAE|nr:uncharacterized protein LOC110674071 [Aedes aegypti]
MLRDEIEQLKARNEAAVKEIRKLQGKLATVVDRDSEYQQLKDEVDILRAQDASWNQKVDENAARLRSVAQSLQEEQDEIDIPRAQNASLSYEVNEATAKLKNLAKLLQEEQLKVNQLEEQLHSQLQPPAAAVFEEIISPKKAYVVKSTSSSVVLKCRISEKVDYIRQLEVEKERLLQEIVELKVRSGKLLEKLKE